MGLHCASWIMKEMHCIHLRYEFFLQGEIFKTLRLLRLYFISSSTAFFILKNFFFIPVRIKKIIILFQNYKKYLSDLLMMPNPIDQNNPHCRISRLENTANYRPPKISYKQSKWNAKIKERGAFTRPIMNAIAVYSQARTREEGRGKEKNSINLRKINRSGKRGETHSSPGSFLNNVSRSAPGAQLTS